MKNGNMSIVKTAVASKPIPLDPGLSTLTYDQINWFLVDKGLLDGLNNHNATAHGVSYEGVEGFAHTHPGYWEPYANGMIITSDKTPMLHMNGVLEQIEMRSKLCAVEPYGYKSRPVGSFDDDNASWDGVKS
jgi:hypothetical protein